jgi:hypothetical protein
LRKFIQTCFSQETTDWRNVQIIGQLENTGFHCGDIFAPGLNRLTTGIIRAGRGQSPFSSWHFLSWMSQDFPYRCLQVTVFTVFVAIMQQGFDQ